LSSNTLADNVDAADVAVFECTVLDTTAFTPPLSLEVFLLVENPGG
jgi:hypothetical protein